MPEARTLLLVSLLLVACNCTSREEDPQRTAGGALPPPRDSTLIVEDEAAPRLPSRPDFERLTVRGDTLRLSDLRGQVVLLNFWATWCPPCVHEIPDLVALHEDLQDEGLTVVGVSVDEEGLDVVGPFVERLGISYPVVLDEEGALSAQFGGVWSLPTTFILDQDGQVMHRIIGIVPVEEMRPTFESMLETQPAAADAGGPQEG